MAEQMQKTGYKIRDESWKKVWDRVEPNWDNYRNVLKGVLVSSISDGHYYLPARAEYALSSLVNGTIEYSGGKSGQLSKDHFNGRLGWRDERHFEIEMWGYLIQETDHRRLSSLVWNSIRDMTHPQQHHAPPDHPYWGTRFHDIYTGPWGGLVQGTSLMHQTVVETREKIIPSFSERERRDVEGIGRSTRRFVEEGLV